MKKLAIRSIRPKLPRPNGSNRRNVNLERFLAILLGIFTLSFFAIEYSRSTTSMQLVFLPKGLEADEKGAYNATGILARPLALSREGTVVVHEIKDCPENSPGLLGPLHIKVDEIQATDEDLFRISNSTRVKQGGWWKPEHCSPRMRVAILVPLRNRPLQLKAFLKHITPVLQRQELHYRIFVVEQIGKTAFNKGAMYNLAFNVTFSFGDYDCYIFHDVDLLTENDHNFYGCPLSPLHMSTAIDKFKYKLPYPNIFGGIQAFLRDHYIRVNGFSNLYWGWGAEDDDMFRRVKKVGLKLARANLDIGRYKMNQGEHFRGSGRKLWEARNKGLLFFHPAGLGEEGLNTISSLTYEMEVREEKLFTHIVVDLSFIE